jgi:protein MAK11
LPLEPAKLFNDLLHSLAPALPPMKLVAGSYERFLFGYHLAPTSLKDEPAEDAELAEPRPLSAAFTYAAHLGPIKSLAASGSYLVSGGSDDIIR